MIQPQAYTFADDGWIPNSRLPVLVYSEIVPTDEPDPAAWLEARFAQNNWLNQWRNGIYSFHHYHSTTHEVLGIYAGSGTVQVGGAGGRVLTLQTGDVVLIPAGVGHKLLNASADFGVVGGYPDGRDWNLLRGEPGERPRADQTIATVPLPTTDPLYGAAGPLVQYWG